MLYASQTADSKRRRAVVTIPGLGCGQIAGRFAGQLGTHLEHTLCRFLDAHHRQLPGIRAVYFDPYQEGENTRSQHGNIIFMVRPMTRGNSDRPQLWGPSQYEESGDDFSNCELFSIVAWDHVSWPGNDFYAGSRATDDGVKAAATSSMNILTGIAGTYDPVAFKYLPPQGYQSWEEVIAVNDLKLQVANNIRILP